MHRTGPVARPVFGLVAGVGCRRGCGAAAIIALVRRAEQAAGGRVVAIAAPAWKRGEPGLHAAAAALGLPLVFVDQAALAAAQAGCRTRSEAALRAVGVASVAEGAALAAAGGRLLLPRIDGEAATCAVATGAAATGAAEYAVVAGEGAGT